MAVTELVRPPSVVAEAAEVLPAFVRQRTERIAVAISRQSQQPLPRRPPLTRAGPQTAAQLPHHLLQLFVRRLWPHRVAPPVRAGSTVRRGSDIFRSRR